MTFEIINCYALNILRGCTWRYTARETSRVFDCQYSNVSKYLNNFVKWGLINRDQTWIPRHGRKTQLTNKGRQVLTLLEKIDEGLGNMCVIKPKYI